MKVSVEEVRFYEWPFKLRMPFRFGVITVTHGRQAVARLRLRTEDGREGWGVAAESLAAKWFDKDPRWTDEQNLDQLRAALEIAARLYRDGGARTPSRISPRTTRRRSSNAGGSASIRSSLASAPRSSIAPSWTRSAASTASPSGTRCGAIWSESARIPWRPT